MRASATLVRSVAAALVASVIVGARAASADTPLAAPPPPEPAPVPAPPPDPVTLDVSLRIGASYRIGDSPSLPITGRFGAMFGAGVAIAPSQRFAIGLAYEHGELGTEHGEGDVGTIDVSRTVDSLWASVRATLWRNERIAIGITLGPGLVWQHVSLNAIVFGNTTWTPTTFNCADTDGPSLGLRAGLGAEITLGNGFYFNLDAMIDELRLSSDIIGTCAPGAGSTATFGVRGGAAYRFDVSRAVR